MPQEQRPAFCPGRGIAHALLQRVLHMGQEGHVASVADDELPQALDRGASEADDDLLPQALGLLDRGANEAASDWQAQALGHTLVA